MCLLYVHTEHCYEVQGTTVDAVTFTGGYERFNFEINISWTRIDPRWILQQGKDNAS